MCGANVTTVLNTLFDLFRSFASAADTSKQYKGCGLLHTRAKWDYISSDCQKLSSAIRFIRMCKPTGVTEHKIISMAITKNLFKREKMAYDAKDYPHSKWEHRLAFKLLQGVPKFQDTLN